MNADVSKEYILVVFKTTELIFSKLIKNKPFREKLVQKKLGTLLKNDCEG